MYALPTQKGTLWTNIGEQMIFNPFTPLGPLEHIVRRLVNYRRIRVPKGWGGHTRAWKQIRKALDSDNPDFALMAAWSILETEVKVNGSCSLRKPGAGRQSSVVDCTVDSLGLNNSEQKLLIKASKQRTDVAHSMDRKNGIVTWNTVNFVLRCAHQLHTL
uniref:Uncharacterized protein n=1 Tax=uncultured marine group II/III euryarchaeote KM3_155_G07 TaxID=1457898 RepID=A0A075GG99_9EURY|nr:hypothetical protein [uncultured marine group II/III euryarchaeote KM3_155_G07]